MNNPCYIPLRACFLLLALPILTTIGLCGETIDFEQLPDGSLAGKKGWTKAFNQFPIVTSLRAGTNTKVLTNPTKGDAGALKILDSGSPYLKEQTQAVFEVDMQLCGTTVGFSRTIAGLAVPNGPRAFSVGLNRAGDKRSFQFVVYTPDDREVIKSVPIPSEVEDGNWIRLIVSFDFTANEGSGAANLSFRNLSLDQKLPQTTGLNEVALNLSKRDASVADPANWGSLFIRVNNSDGKNLTDIALGRIYVGNDTLTQ